MYKTKWEAKYNLKAIESKDFLYFSSDTVLFGHMGAPNAFKNVEMTSWKHHFMRSVYIFYWFADNQLHFIL